LLNKGFSEILISNKPKRLIKTTQQDPDPLSQSSYSGRESNNLKKWLFLRKASIPFALTFSLIVLPIAKSEGDEIFKSKNIDSNSQNLKLLKPEMEYNITGPTGGSEVVIEENALVSSGLPTGETESKAKIINSSSDEINIYTVREGDTLSQISEMFDVKKSTIKGFNNLKSDNDLKVGQEILILPIDGVLYKVEKGDTLSSVAKKWKSDETDISLFNDIGQDGKLTVGSEIIIPGAEAPEPEKKVAVKTSTKTSTAKSTGSAGGSYSSGFYTHPIPHGSVKSQGFHGPYEAQDLAAKIGTKIVASSAGRVIAVKAGEGDWNGGYGKMVIIDDGRATVLYAHMSKVSVTQGQVVNQGQEVGLVGSTGRSTGPHLHIEYRGKNGPMKTPVW